MVWKAFLDSLHQWPRSLRFTYGNAVKPNNRLSIVNKWRQLAEALAEPCDILAMSNSVDEKVREQYQEGES